MISSISEADAADEKRFEGLKQKHKGFFFSKEMRGYWKGKIDKEIQEMDEDLERGVRKTPRERVLRLLIKRAVSLELIARHDTVCNGCPLRDKDFVKFLGTRSQEWP